MLYEPRAIVTESLDSKQSNMAFDWLMSLLKDCYDPVELAKYTSASSIEHLAFEDLEIEEGSIAWTRDLKTKNEAILIGLGDSMQACFSKRHFQRQTQIVFAAPTALCTLQQVEYWGRYLVDLSQFYQNTIRRVA